MNHDRRRAVMIMRKPLQTRENDRMLEPRRGNSEALANDCNGVMMAVSKGTN